eukprot:m.161303 g.161303  ORF g.161303 m.161303 type:complete len:275 (-) comp16524_c0_seq2:46-870(-)
MTLHYLMYAEVDELRQHHNDRLSELVEQEKQQTQAVAVAITKRASVTSDRRDTGELLSMLVKNKLSFESGERLDVIRMTSCPGGHWYCRRQQDDGKGEEGFVPIDHVEIDAGSVSAVLSRAYSRKASQDEDASPAAIPVTTAVDDNPSSSVVAVEQTTAQDLMESTDTTPPTSAGNDGAGSSKAIGPGSMVVSIFDYVGEESKELTFEAGTVLRVEKLEAGGWLLATVIRLAGDHEEDGSADGVRRPSIRHHRGWLPSGYVQLLDVYKADEDDE